MGAQVCYPVDTPRPGCIYCEAVDAVEGVPSRIVEHPIEGWNAGARSQVELAVSDLRTVFQVGQAVGIVMGLAYANAFAPADPATIQHGVYLWTQGGALLGQVYEAGAAASAMFERAHDDTFEIRRLGTQVSYRINGTQFHVSGVPSHGNLIVGCCLYMTGDTVL